MRSLGTLRRAVQAAALLSLVTACTAVGPPVDGAPPHHRAYGFANPNGKTGPDSIDFLVDRTRLAFLPVENSPVAALSEEEARHRWARMGQRNAVQWLGHASVRIRLAGQTILVDPVLSDVLSPAPPFGPHRATDPPVPASALVDPDAILITHNHYDHYEPETIRRIAGASTTCLLPLRVARGHQIGCPPTEVDWGHRHRIGSVRITFLEAQHDSARSLSDRDRTLWGAFMLEGGGKRIYVSGDTGYGPHFARATAAGPIDLAILNVGGYKPRRLNRYVHITPEEAVQAVRDLGARRALIVHWGTYGLGLETGRETYDRTREAARAAGLPPGTILFMQIGDAAPI